MGREGLQQQQGGWLQPLNKINCFVFLYISFCIFVFSFFVYKFSCIFVSLYFCILMGGNRPIGERCNHCLQRIPGTSFLQKQMTDCPDRWQYTPSPHNCQFANKSCKSDNTHRYLPNRTLQTFSRRRNVASQSLCSQNLLFYLALV